MLYAVYGIGRSHIKATHRLYEMKALHCTDTVYMVSNVSDIEVCMGYKLQMSLSITILR